MPALPPAPGRPVLAITVDGQTKMVRLDADRYRLGRALSNELCYPEVPELSREHLALEREGARWTVRDLGSTNGTFLNGTLITGARPLQSRDCITIGNLSLVFDQPERASTSAGEVVFEEKPSTTAAETTMAVSLQNLLVEPDQAQGARYMEVLVRAGRELVTHLPLEKLFDVILNLSVEAAGAARGVLMTLENEELRLRSSKGAGFRISSHVRDVVIQQRRSLLVRDALSDQVLAARQSIVQQQIRSIMAVPLQTADRVIGLIYLDSPHFVRAFTKEDLSLLTLMANIAAIRIENARLAEVEQAEKLRAQELEHAALIQRSILPGRFPPFPDRRDFGLHAAMLPAREVGGDFFDFFLLGPDRLGFLIGDVSGKGVPSALFMAVSRTLLRAAAQHQKSPGECLSYVNAALLEQPIAAMFVTVFYGVLDTRTGMLEFANAGHNPPYLFGCDGQMRVLREGSGPILGMLRGPEFATATTQINPGDGVLLYTDGVTEALDPAEAFFTEQRLEAYLAEHAANSLEALVGGLQDAVRRFSSGAPQSDDITLLALRYYGRTAP